MKDVLALIPARGGSKGIPRKNLRLVGGRALVARSIDHARTSRLITRVIVSTEDAEIAEVARREGAEVPFLRPLELAGDAVRDLPHAPERVIDSSGSAGRLARSFRRPAENIPPAAERTIWCRPPRAQTSRRDANWSDRDGRAPLFQLNRSGKTCVCTGGL